MGKQARLRQERRVALANRRAHIVNIVTAFEECSPSTIYSMFKANSCLNATRIAMEVFTDFGLKVEPCPVKAMVMNELAWQEYQTAVDHETYSKNTANGAWSLALGFKPHEVAGMVKEANYEDGWWGHITCLVEGIILVDASARQMNRPEYDIIAADCLTMDVSDAFMKGYPMFGRTEHGTVVTYQRIEADYQEQIGFGRTMPNMVAAEMISRNMRRLLAERSLPKLPGA